MKPLVSIILPTYNRADFLGRSIISVLNQQFANFELIIVDDASVDNSKEVIAVFDDQRIIYLKHERNLGGSAARNTGIRAAQGDFIAFQDSDDEWYPEKLEKQIKIMIETPPNVGVVYTGFLRVQGENKEYIPGPEIQIKEGNIFRELLKGNFVTTQAVLVKKECFQKAGMFDETLPRLQDWELFLRIAKFYEFCYIPEPLVKSFYTEGSISSNPKALIEAFEIIMGKNIADYKADQELYVKKLNWLFNHCRIENDIKKIREYLIKLFQVYYRPGLILAIITTFLGIRFFNFYWDLMTRVQGKKEA